MGSSHRWGHCEFILISVPQLHHEKSKGRQGAGRGREGAGRRFWFFGTFHLWVLKKFLVCGFFYSRRTFWDYPHCGTSSETLRTTAFTCRDIFFRVFLSRCGQKSVTRGVWRPTENSHFFLIRVVYFVRTVGLIFSSSSFQNPSYHGISERGGFWRFWFFGNFHLWVFHNNSHLWVLLTIGVILSSSLFQYPTYFVRSERGRILT